MGLVVSSALLVVPSVVAASTTLLGISTYCIRKIFDGYNDNYSIAKSALIIAALATTCLAALAAVLACSGIAIWSMTITLLFMETVKSNFIILPLIVNLSLAYWFAKQVNHYVLKKIGIDVRLKDIEFSREEIQARQKQESEARNKKNLAALEIEDNEEDDLLDSDTTAPHSAPIPTHRHTEPTPKRSHTDFLPPGFLDAQRYFNTKPSPWPSSQPSTENLSADSANADDSPPKTP